MMKNRTVLLAVFIILCAICAGITISRNNGLHLESPVSDISEDTEVSQIDAGNAADISSGEESALNDAYKGSQMSHINGDLTENKPDDNYGTTYEVFVYSFADSNDDGVGDLKGLCDNIGYINDGQPSSGPDLAANEIWLMPIFPSPTYHKYDTVDYMDIDPEYGTLQDFDDLLEACHKRNVKVILDLAFNHTSTEHAWFKAAKEYLQNLPSGKDPVKEECPYVWYYVFSREKYNGFVPLDDTWFYEARFWEGMPDLNLSTPEVREELTDVLKFWLDRGVDGFRLDAVTSYVSDSTEGNMEFMKWVADTVHGIKDDAYIVAEAWENQAAYSKYYSTGVDSFFDFAYSGADGIIASVAKGNRSAKYFAESLVEEEKLYASYNENFINAPFYTNHDMARSAGYYANDDGSRTKFAGALNLLMTGNAFVYYGEEIGMKGSGRDENKRVPMYWITEDEASESSTSTDDTNSESTVSWESASVTDDKMAADLFRKTYGRELLSIMCKGPEEMESFPMKFGTVYEQIGEENSIHTYFRNAIRIRNAFPVIARGSTSVDYDRTNNEICAMTREDPEGRYEPVEIFINSTENPSSVDISTSSYSELSAVLTVSDEDIVLKDGVLTLPPFGICVMREQ